ncbi:MAG: 2-hydroxychromene-2-carboxylate isomerase [Pseudomonadota bacterium]
MTKSVDFYFDFASPNAYFAHKVLPSVCARCEAEIVLKPALLGGIFRGTNNQAPMVAFASVKGKVAYEMLEVQRFIARHQLSAFKMNSSFPVNTLMLMRAAMTFDDQDLLQAFLNAGMRAMWELDRKMDDADIFVRTLTELGFDGAGLLAATQDASIKEALKSATETAVARGIFGLPTFFVGEEMFFGKERLGQVEDMLGGER